jgi:hypothetical protein
LPSGFKGQTTICRQATASIWILRSRMDIAERAGREDEL